MRYSILIAAAMTVAAGPGAAHEVIHGAHGDHAHARGCGHMAVAHDGHSDYLHDGHLHSMHAGHADEHVLAVSRMNPAAEKPVTGHAAHAAGDGHQMVQHGTHFDCVHDGRLHHAHADHVDDHGAVTAG